MTDGEIGDSALASVTENQTTSALTQRLHRS